jgi:pyruvate ferredoxin oxidoreductase delta subunit
MSNKLGWNEFDAGSILFSFNNSIDQTPSMVKPEDRDYSQNNSHYKYVGDWRVEKPVFNGDFCINCQFCWVYCPDTSIVSKDKKFDHIDYNHCKGCGVCVDVCPTNPKSLLMFMDHEDNDVALTKWPQKQ